MKLASIRRVAAACTSAHLDTAASEDLVPCGHSCPSHPATIRALRRILLAHARSVTTPP